jgi:hypothetical protein
VLLNYKGMEMCCNLVGALQHRPCILCAAVHGMQWSGMVRYASARLPTWQINILFSNEYVHMV